MNHAYYSSGEKIDGEYVLPEMKDINLYNAILRQKTRLRPQEFTPEYYDKKMAKYNPTLPEYYEWKCFKKYALATFDFYERAIIAFNKKFYLDKSVIKDYIFLDSTETDLERAANSFHMSEDALFLQYFKSYGRKMSAKLNKCVPLQRVRHTGLVSIMMQDTLNSSLPVSTMLKFTDSYQKLDLNKDEDVLKAYRGYVILKREINRKVQPSKVSNYYDDIYEGENFLETFDEVCELIGAFTSHDLDDIYTKIRPQLQNLSKNAQFTDLIRFYSLYDNINRIFYNIATKTTWYNKGYGKRIDTYYDIDTSEDIYETGVKYLGLIQKIMRSGRVNELFMADLVKLNDIGTQVIEEATDIHKETHEFDLSDVSIPIPDFLKNEK